MKKLFFVTLLAALGFSACDRNQPDPVDDPLKDVVYDPTPVHIDVPIGVPRMPISDENPLTEQGIALGKALYYDPIIDGSGDRACGACHLQEYSFSSGPTVMPHVNLGFDKLFLWNGSVQGTLEDAMYFEVDDFFETDVSVLNEHSTYPTKFKQAFGINKIETKHVAWALAQYMRTQNSFNSWYDKDVRGDVNLTPLQKEGEEIYFSEKGDCFHCHGYPLMKDNELHNNGLNDDYSHEEDQGYYTVSGDMLDMGKFKTPTLRNIALTAPYMHDGRFETLTEVVTFYSEGVKDSEYVDPLMKQAQYGGIGLEQDEIQALVAFLHTFTDSTFIADPTLRP